MPSQRRRVHFARNLLAPVPKSHQDMVAAVFRIIFAQHDADAVSATWDHVRAELTARFPKIGPLLDDAKTEVLAFTAFPQSHWTNDLVQQPHRTPQPRHPAESPRPWDPPQLRRPHPPGRAVLDDAHDECQVADRRYLSEASMALLHKTSDTDTAAITLRPVSTEDPSSKPTTPRCASAPRAGRRRHTA